MFSFDQYALSEGEVAFALAKHLHSVGRHADAVDLALRGLGRRPGEVFEARLMEIAAYAGYHVEGERRERCEQLAERLALDRDAQGGVRAGARASLVFYARSAVQLFPSFKARRLRPLGVPPGFSLQNASVVLHQGAIRCAVRLVNYRKTERGVAYMPLGQDTNRSRNLLLTLSEELEILSERELADPPDLPKYSSARGLEDPRLFARADELWLIATTAQVETDGCPQMVVGRVADETIEAWNIVRATPARRPEKNWMPILDGIGERFLYLCDPTTVLDIGSGTLAFHDPALALDSFSGGSQLVPFRGGWLAVVHERDRPAGFLLSYQHRFVWFDSDLTIRGLSRRFYLGERSFQFVAGLCWHPDGRRLVMSYGAGLDAESWVATLEAEDAAAALYSAADLESIFAPLPFVTRGDDQRAGC